MDLKPSEEILKALNEIDDLNNEQVRKKARKRSSILKLPKTSDDDFLTEDAQNKRKSITSKRVSFADKFQVMELCTGNIYDVSGRSGSTSESVIGSNLVSEMSGTAHEEKSKIAEVSRVDIQISTLTEMHERKFGLNSSLNISRKHKPCSDEQVEPKRKKCSFSYNYNSSLDVQVENKSSAQINNESERCFDRMLYTFNKNYSGIGQNQDVKLTCSKQNFHENSIFEEMIKEMRLETQPEDFPSVIKGNSEKPHLYQSGNIPVEEKKQSASNIFSAFDSDKNIKSVDCLSKYDNISNNKLNMKLYPVTSCNISLNENKENIYVDLKNKSILITNERQLNLGKEALLPTSQSQSVSSFEPQVSYVKNYRPQVCTTSIMQFAVDARENTSSQDKTKEYLFDQQKNVDCDKTCLIAASMDMTCLGIDTNKFDDSDVSNKDECLQSYQTRKIHTSESVNHENNESKIDFPRRIIVENSLDTFKSKKPERIFNKTKLFVEDMDMTCVENDILKNPTDASFCSSDVLSERDSEISLAAKDDEKLFPSEHNSHSDNNLKAETSISTYEYEKKLGLNKTCFFNNSMDMTCLAPNCDELDDSSYIVPEERVQNLKKYQTDNLPIDNIHCASENKPFVMNTTAVHYSENDTKRSEGGLDKTNLYANDMDMTCCVDKDFYNRLNKPSTTISDLDLYSEDSLNAAKQKTASNSSVVPDCVKQLSAFHHDVNSGKRSTHLMSELLYQDVESKEVSPNKSEGKTKLILVDMDMTCIVKTQGKDLAKQNIPTADLNLVPESVVNVTEHKSISDSILTFSFAKQQPVSQGDFKDMKEKDLSLCKSIIHGTQTNLFPVDMDVTCMHEKSCVDPSEQGFISTDFSPVSENFRGAVVKQDHNSVLSANFESSEKQSSEVPKFIFKDNKKENTSSCKRLSETRYIEDQSIFLSDCSPPKKYGNYEKGNIHSNQIYIHDDKLESLHTAIKSKISHSDMLCENVSVVNDKENPLHFQHVENLENFSQDKMHTYMPKYKRMDFNETHISDNSIDIACSLAHNVESDCNSQHNKNNIHNLNHSHSADFYETNRNASHIKNKPYINEETTPSISLNRPIKTLNQSKFCIENEFATNAEGCSNKYSLIESTHANSEDDLKHDKCVTMEQRDRENISSSNIESNNKMIESVKFANVGITYAIKQLKEMNKSPPSDVFKFPEVFFSLRKQPKPQTSFSCTRVELCEAVQNAIRQSSSFNYGLEELSFTAKINRKSCSVSISEQDKLDGKETPVDPSVNLYLSNSTFIPEYSENIENLRKLGTIDDISLQKTSQYLNSPQEEVLNLMSDSILDNSFVRNGTNSINFTVPPSLHENTLHQNTPTNSKFKLTIEKIVTPQSIKKIIRMEEEKLTSEIFIGDVSCKGTINPEIMITNSFVNTSVTDRVNSSANILKNMEETQTHSLSSVSVKTHQHVISNSKKSSISKRMSAERFKIPSEEENDSVSRNLNPQFEQLSEFDSSLSNSKDEVFLPSEPKNSVSNIDLHCENQVLSDGSQNCNEGKKENDEISNSKNSQNWDEGKIDNVSNSEKTAYHEVENNCVTNGKEYKQIKTKENLPSSSLLDTTEQLNRSIKKSDIQYQRKIEKLSLLRKKFIKASEDVDNLWELKEINENQAVFELNGYCSFACYLMKVPLGLESEVLQEAKISFQHLKPNPDEIDELGLSLFCTRVSHEAETLSFHGDIETVMVNAEKLLHKISKYLEILSVAKALIKDIWSIGIKNKISMDNSQEFPRLIVEILNQNMFSLFNLTFPLNLKTYPLEKIVPVFQYLEFTNIENEVILGAVNKIEPGAKYLFRMVEAAHTLK